MNSYEISVWNSNTINSVIIPNTELTDIDVAILLIEHISQIYPDKEFTLLEYKDGELEMGWLYKNGVTNTIDRATNMVIAFYRILVNCITFLRR